MKENRRSFIKQSAALAGGIIVQPFPVSQGAYVGGSDIIKVGLVGCGDRGTGAAVQALKASPNVRLTAMCDVFADQVTDCYNKMENIPEVKSQLEVQEDLRFSTFDGYKKVIEVCDAVILATPPGFRPEHFEEAVRAGKHVFMEKPLASDAPGVKRILAAGKKAEAKNLKVVVGLQNRYDPNYHDLVQRLQNGAIGDIVSSECYFMKGQYEIVPRSVLGSELAFQIKNYHFFNWLWAGGPAGLQIHNTDVVNWVKGAYPIQAQGMGGRSSISGPDTGEVFDHFYIEYLYADGTKIHSQIRVITNAMAKNGVYFNGSKGTASLYDGIKNKKGKNIWQRDESAGNPYQIEHDRFFEAIMMDKPINDTEYGAKSTLVAIMGRMAAHSGKMVTWEEAKKSETILLQDGMTWDTTPPVVPDENFMYNVPIPGRHRV